MTNPLFYHQKVKNEQHIFIYCVGGRSSSTAFQRIINSSNQICIWGEPHGLIDETVSHITRLKVLQNTQYVKDSLARMYKSYTDNKHIHFYPNALGNIGTTVELMNSSISVFLTPWVTKLKRFGFKDIEVKNKTTLCHLKEIFPESIFLFCFRNPVPQWQSVKQLTDWWEYVKKVELFLEEYYRISSVYLEFSLENNLPAFIENNDLRDNLKIDHIIKYANIQNIDRSLIDVTIDSVKSCRLSEDEHDIILNSNAYKNYIEMEKRSKLFFDGMLKRIEQKVVSI